MVTRFWHTASRTERLRY